MTTVVYECIKKIATKHVFLDNGKTKCGKVPTKAQWARGIFAFEHEISKEQHCAKCWRHYEPKTIRPLRSHQRRR